MTVAVPAMTTFPFPLFSTARPVVVTEKRHRCMRDGKLYAGEFDCPCWTALPVTERRSLSADLLSWFNGFSVAAA